MGSPVCTKPLQRCHVLSLISTCPRRLKDSMRDARFTSSPMTVYSE
jgi:hypothetical protein